jgi:propanol-preferring alcohol dehydrogenase
MLKICQDYLYAPLLFPVTALRAVREGGTVVCAGIRMSDIPSFSDELLWGERVVRSVAVEPYLLEQANQALDALRSGRLRGAAVLDCRAPALVDSRPPG